MRKESKTFRLPVSLVKKLKRFSVKMRISQTDCVIAALNDYIDEYEEVSEAKRRLDDPSTEYISAKELRKRLGI